ncbi:hypothetical protein ABIF90_007334 [Bradyrhizobium japonicum]
MSAASACLTSYYALSDLQSAPDIALFPRMFRMHVQKKLRGRDDLWQHSHNRSRLMRFGDGTINFSDLKRTHLGFGTVTLPSRQFGAGDRDYFGVPYQQAGGARMRGNEALAVPRAPGDPQLSANRHWAFLLSFPPNRAPDWYGSPKPQSEVNRLCRSVNWDGMLVDQALATPATVLDRCFQLVIGALVPR